MSTEQPGRSGRQTSSTGPIGSTIAIVVTVVAVVLGFLILKRIKDDNSSGSTKPDTTTTTVASGATTTTQADAVTTTTEFVLVTTGTKVEVSNASNQNGVAKLLTTALAGKGFSTVTAVNGTGKVDKSQVLYDPANPAAKNVALSVAHLMGDIDVEPLGTPVPTATGKLADGVGVLVILGKDLAGKTLDQMQGGTATPGSTPVTGGATPTT